MSGSWHYLINRSAFWQIGTVAIDDREIIDRCRGLDMENARHIAATDGNGIAAGRALNGEVG